MGFLDEAIKRILAAKGLGPSPIKPKEPKGTFQVKGNMRDDRTFGQLAEAKFSGLRANDLWLRFELWILGRLDRTISYDEFFKDPESLNRCYAEAFGLDVQFSAGAMHDIKRLQERRHLLQDTDVSKALQAREDAERKKK